jgi:hypothetical protein
MPSCLPHSSSSLTAYTLFRFPLQTLFSSSPEKLFLVTLSESRCSLQGESWALIILLSLAVWLDVLLAVFGILTEKA